MIRLHIVKTAILPKLIYTFKVASVKISAGFSTETDKLILRFKWKDKDLE